MIKVLELIDGGFLGGGQTHILSLVGNLNTEKYEAIIAAAPKGEFKEEVFKKGFKFENVYLTKLYKGKYLHTIDKIVKDNNISIIHSHGGIAGMYARFYKKKYDNVSIVHTIHGIHYNRTGNFLKKVFSQSTEQHLVKYTDRFICVSDEDRKLAEKMKIIDPMKTNVIKNGINVRRFADKKKNPELLKKYNIGENDFIIGNISRFDYQKNQRQLIKVFSVLTQRIHDIKLLLVGDGKLYDECVKQAELEGVADKVIFTGEVANVEDYYPLIDIFVFPSLWEGLSITLIEAQVSGRCIIASNIPSNRELIQDNETGLLYDVNDEESLYNRIQNVYVDKFDRERLSENATKEGMKYNEKEMAEKIESVYDKVSGS